MHGDITNALSVDLEDWAQSTLNPHLPITSRVVRNTECLLALFDRFKVKATFFALGKVCEKYPQLLPMIAAEGHEIGTHGYGHELLHTLTPQRFRSDVGRSIDIIQSQTDRRPIGYRAPAFSVTRRTLWAGPILADMGIQYSSSIFPIAGRRYGIPDADRFPHVWSRCRLVEFPLTTVRRFGRNLPVAGGGYMRLLPVALTAAAIREVNGEGRPAVVYIHPYEIDVREPAVLRRHGWPVGWRRYVHQSLFRGRVRARLSSLLEAFSFAPLADVLAQCLPTVSLLQPSADPPVSADRATLGVLRRRPSTIGSNVYAAAGVERRIENLRCASGGLDGD